MAAYQDKRSVKITSPFGANVLLFARLSGTEHVSQPFHYQLELLSENGELDPDKILGKPLAVELASQPSAAPRYIHGLVSEFSQGGYEERFHQYRAVIRPWYWFLTRTADCRIFQKKNVKDIFEQVCKQVGFSDLELRLGSYDTREYCVQYRETDFNFLSRLLEQEGIFYFFEHSAGKHVMVLCDDVSKCKVVAGYETVPYFPPSTSEALRTRDHLDSWSFQKSFQTGTVASRDYDFIKPSPVPAGTSSISRDHNATKYEVFDYPADATTLDSSGVEHVAKLRVQELQASQMLAQGSGDAVGLAAGTLFTLKDYPRSSLNIQYLLTSTTIELAADDYHSGGKSGGTHFSISVEAVDSREAYRPPRLTPKPVIQGTQTAIVVGPKGDEIHTDEYGRIRVQFHWDRYGKLDDSSSCFIRVATLWAGKTWGGIHIPRIGQEVVVSFLEGDPDRPLVIGSVYNGSNKVPYSLPDNKTQSGVKSRSSLGGTDANFNEFRFEDKKGSELVFLHAEKNQTIEVENDEAHSVGHDRKKDVKNNETVSIGKDRTETVGNNEQITVSKNRTESVGADESITVSGGQTVDVGKDYALSVGGGRTLSVGKDETISISGGRTDEVGKSEELSVGKDRKHSITDNDSLSVGKKLLIDAGDEVVISTGSASITMKKDGTITIKGNNITLDGDGKINVKAGGDVVMKGSKITQN